MLISVAEPFHGCKESLYFYIKYVKKIAKTTHVYVSIEMMSHKDSEIINKCIDNNESYEQINNKLVDKLVLMKKHIIFGDR